MTAKHVHVRLVPSESVRESGLHEDGSLTLTTASVDAIEKSLSRFYSSSENCAEDIRGEWLRSMLADVFSLQNIRIAIETGE